MTPRTFTEYFNQDSPLIIALLLNDHSAAQLLIRNGADPLYRGNQKTHSFAVIHRRKVKSLLQLLKDYYPTKKFRELETKSKALEAEFVDFLSSKKVNFLVESILELDQFPEHPCQPKNPKNEFSKSPFPVLKEANVHSTPKLPSPTSFKVLANDTERLETHQRLWDIKNKISSLQIVN